MAWEGLPPPRARPANDARAGRARARAPDHRAHHPHPRAQAELAALVESYAPQLLAERGCGPLTAAKLIGEIAGADRFATDAKLARTGGAAPIPASSGNTNRHRLDRGGNRQLNCALHRLAVNKGKWDPDTAAYLARKQAEGKSRKEALRCLKRHLARRVWKLLHNASTRRGTRRRTSHDSPDDRRQRPDAHALLDIGATHPCSSSSATSPRSPETPATGRSTPPDAPTGTNAARPQRPRLTVPRARRATRRAATAGPAPYATASIRDQVATQPSKGRFRGSAPRSGPFFNAPFADPAAAAGGRPPCRPPPGMGQYASISPAGHRGPHPPRDALRRCPPQFRSPAGGSRAPAARVRGDALGPRLRRPAGAYANCLALSARCAQWLRAGGVECGLLHLAGSLEPFPDGTGRWPFCDHAEIEHWTVRAGDWSIDWTARQFHARAQWPEVERVEALAARWRTGRGLGVPSLPEARRGPARTWS